MKNYYQYPHPEVKILQKYDYTMNGQALFNPSIVKYKNKYMCIARSAETSILHSKTNSEIVYSELTKDLEPLKWRSLDIDIPQTLLIGYHNAQYEDSRFYILNDRLFSLQTLARFTNDDKADCKMCLVEWDEDMNLIGMRIYIEFEGRQKNWSLIRYKDKNYIITDFSPLRYYEIDIDNGYQLSNKKEIHHEYKNYFGTKVYDIQDNKLKCMAHNRYFKQLYYLFQLFEIDLEKQTIHPLSKKLSFSSMYGSFFQYPHHINKIDDRWIMTLGIENRKSLILELFF
jgi:predicted GH43/DUF377 family glycosyl hydrolase